MYLFEMLVDLLPARLQPAAKAVYPAIATVVAAVVLWVSTGATEALTVAVTGLVGAVLAYAFPNLRRDESGLSFVEAAVLLLAVVVVALLLGVRF